MQFLNAQIVIGTPNLGFSQACASESFNSYDVTFVFSPENGLQSSNQFVLEMSDADGDFSNATVIYTSGVGTLTESPATLNFSLPTTTAGENYKIRIKSTAPVATSSSSVAFAAYYKLQDSPFSINNLVSSGAYCPGGAYLLTIDNPGINENDSPLNYPSLTYNWYRETSPTTSEFIDTGETLSVSEEGIYFVETNYGTCTSDSFSNRVEIIEATTGEANATIISSLGNPYCPEQGLTTLSTIGALSYQWYKDGELIEGADAQMYQTNESGEFSVQVDLGDCQTSGTIDLQSQLFEMNINVSETNEIDEGDSLDVEITTNANNPEFLWYYNNSPIEGEYDDNYSASEFGMYKVVVTETLGCTGSREFTFELTEAPEPFPDVENIPNVISPNGDGINDTWVIPTAFVSGTETSVRILTSQGKQVFQTNDYQNNWPIDNLNSNSINQVFYYIIITSTGDTRKGSITIIK
ncbi:gliding motility-associated C-terminal domain-containing protein [uncultured Winogradskyella sp.]|uniref:T9SS type B sorting domain-containing protein n=1 Tax=uncultured Winogradskyella sp. TaxID=395353 RepID=UPI002627A39A|nr:gliding motility-associated C-terminal domain-containing protein [uncultured Winogradskyella sp.]